MEQGLKACSILKFSREEAWVFSSLGLSDIKKRIYDKHEDYCTALCRELAK